MGKVIKVNFMNCPHVSSGIGSLKAFIISTKQTI